jgi:hypothetical protein
MTTVYSSALEKSIQIDRMIGHIKGKQPGPAILFTGGIHGNEPSGVFALRKVIEEMVENNIEVSGNIYAIGGNLAALEKGERYRQQDLNRLWTIDRMRQLYNGEISIKDDDEKQQLAICQTIKEIISTEKGPFYFMDLHTTSSETIPFLTVNDNLMNRDFTKQFPVPIVLGIEEHLDGPLLSYINELGYIAFGYEGGQHDDLASIENHIAFIYLSLVFTGAVQKNDIDYRRYYDLLAKTSINSRDFYEIFYHYKIKEGEEFLMKPGFFNFQKIRKKQELATCEGEMIYARRKGRMLMPRYQNKGDDGFFIIREIRPFYLRLSRTLRKIRLDHILPLLPGVRWRTKKHNVLIVNRKVAWLFAKQFFHLMGYRSRKLDETHLVVRNREAISRTKDYSKAPWKNKKFIN